VAAAKAGRARAFLLAALRAGFDAAIALGVEGVPTVVVGHQAFWGDDRLEDAARALRI
jgi:2-hydroxychromene-2-carboxylate isomerase